MKRVFFAVAAVAFGASAPADAATPDVEAAFKVLRSFGAQVQMIEPYDDAAQRRECGFAEKGQGLKIHASVWGRRAAGHVEPDLMTFRQFVAIDADGAVECYDRVQFRDIKFEDSAIVGATMEVRATSPADKIRSDATLQFNYDWRKLATNIDLQLEAHESGLMGKRLLAFYASLGLGGIDMIGLQEPKQRNDTNLLTLLGASLRSAKVKFHDNGFLDLLFDQIAKEQGSSKRKAQRELYTTFEQARQLLAASGNNVLADAVQVVQDTLIDGGGGEISIEPSKPVTLLELIGALDSNTLEDVLDGINMTSKRIP